ncbi:hypothetical protein VE02_09619 [Pseudogymnoascus sp. 03VT05]|nr:hypothetical protein VE02_09619 [Pseudogymnoascus sp. 03VT05]
MPDSSRARELSDGLKAEVRHLGTWNDVGANQKRDSGPATPLEVFGIKNGDHEFHFTYAGRDAEGKDSVKLGLGDGSFQPNSKGRRQYASDYSDVYFTEGGIDFAIQSVQAATSPQWDWGSPGNAVEVTGIYESVSYYLGAAGTFTNFAFIIKTTLSFQIYDSLLKYTLSAGIMAPFSATQGSGIWSMKIEGGVEQNSCAPF